MVLPRRVALRQCKYLNNVIEQDHRTVKKRSLAGQGLWILSECVADVAEYRDSEHDPEGPSEMAGQRRCGRPSSLHRRAVRTLCLTQDSQLTGLYWPASPPPPTSQQDRAAAASVL